MNTKKVILGSMVLASLTLWNCENTVDNGKTEIQPVKIEPTQEVVQTETENVAALAIAMQSQIITDFESLKSLEAGPTFDKTANTDKVYR